MGDYIPQTDNEEIEAALVETISRTIISGGKKSEFKRLVAKNLFRSMGAASKSYKRFRIQEVNKLVDLLWKECLKTIANTASSASNGADTGDSGGKQL